MTAGPPRTTSDGAETRCYRSSRARPGRLTWHGRAAQRQDLSDSNPFFAQAFVEAGVQAGHARNPDFNGASQRVSGCIRGETIDRGRKAFQNAVHRDEKRSHSSGYGKYFSDEGRRLGVQGEHGGLRLSPPSQVTHRNDERWSADCAYLTPSLEILTGAHATRVLAENGRAVGAVDERLHLRGNPDPQGKVEVSNPYTDDLELQEFRMTTYIFQPTASVDVAVQGSTQRYAVRRIFCVGRNYAAHAREMGSDPTREPPFFFTKSPAHLVASGATVPYPPGTNDYHHEMELVVAIGRPAFGITPEEAQACVWAYACGLDMTRRDLQADARKDGRPWSFSKDFENAAVIGALVPARSTGVIARGAIELYVSGKLRQGANLADMIWSVPEVIANLSQYYHLGPGDLIYTGTPEGVGAVQAGDVLTGRIEGVGDIKLTIGKAE